LVGRPIANAFVIVIVPSPGISRSGTHASTTRLTAIVTTPMLTPRWAAMPWCHRDEQRCGGKSGAEKVAA
jgi:hypothetical protein